MQDTILFGNLLVFDDFLTDWIWVHLFRIAYYDKNIFPSFLQLFYDLVNCFKPLLAHQRSTKWGDILGFKVFNFFGIFKILQFFKKITIFLKLKENEFNGKNFNLSKGGDTNYKKESVLL